MQPAEPPSSQRGTFRQQGILPVKWDAVSKQFTIALHGVALEEIPGAETRIVFNPPHLYDIRIRRKGTDSPLLGFLSPSSSAVFVGVESGAEYEVVTQAVDAKTGDPLPGHEPDTQTLRAEE